MANGPIAPEASNRRQRPGFTSVVPDTGFLTDSRIRAALDSDYLIEPGTWDASQVRHASYTLRLGHRVEIERHEDAQRATRQRAAITLRRGGEPLVLQPGDTALLYSI